MSLRSFGDKLVVSLAGKLDQSRMATTPLDCTASSSTNLSRVSSTAWYTVLTSYLPNLEARRTMTGLPHGSRSASTPGRPSRRAVWMAVSPLPSHSPPTLRPRKRSLWRWRYSK
ncbi:hypothetical protein E2C01_027457 [Portunus trituberculatus]|uniref:Uncharacterized protein n=1 Tax=Portunus trituberculatus TaxID=210409 RepID=A0A5B7EM05_PORTR|nr:hypothetical protein [Portunus trituberculatus]